MDHRFDNCKHLRRFLVGGGRRPGREVPIAYIHWNSYGCGDIHGSIVLGGRRCAWRDRDSGETPFVGEARETLAKIPLKPGRVYIRCPFLVL